VARVQPRSTVPELRVAILSSYALSAFGAPKNSPRHESSARRSRPRRVDRGPRPATTTRPTHHARARGAIRHGAQDPGQRKPRTADPLASAARHARRTVEHFGPDVVHFHEPFAPTHWLGCASSARRPAVATFHRGAGPALRPHQATSRRLALHLDAAAAVSESAASTIKAACGIEATVLFTASRWKIRRHARGRETRGLVVLDDTRRKGSPTPSTPFVRITPRTKIPGGSRAGEAPATFTRGIGAGDP